MSYVKPNHRLRRGRFERWRVRSHVALGVLALGTASGAASASKSYGYYLISYYDFRPGCEGCHVTPLGGLGTVMKPFGLTLRGLGLTGGDNLELLLETLNQLGDADSDGDGASDAFEVMAQGDPNDPEHYPAGFVPEPTATQPSASAPGAASDEGTDPAAETEQTSCAFTSAAHRASALSFQGLLLSLGVLVWARRRCNRASEFA
jgi:hypothetical protein